MRRLFTTVMTGAFALGGAGTLAACGSDDAAETLIERATGEDVDIDFDDESFRVETDEGEISFGGCERLPDDFPSEVPLPDAEPQTCGSFSTPDREDWSLIYGTGDADAVTDFKSALEDAGFEIEGEFRIDSGEGAYESFTASRGDLTVNVAGGADIADGGGISVTVSRTTDGS